MKNTIAKIAAMALVIMMTVGFVAEATTVTTDVTTEQPVIEQVIVEEPVVDEPVVEEPVVEEPVVEEPVVEEPVVEEPVVEEPVVEEPVVEEPVVEEPVVEEPVVEEPVVEEPVVEEPVVDYSGLKVEIDSNLDEVIMEGEEIRLTSTLTGFEGLTYYLQWQYNDGEGWKNVEGATEGTYTFIATEETLGYEWRLMVTL